MTDSEYEALLAQYEDWIARQAKALAGKDLSLRDDLSQEMRIALFMAGVGQKRALYRLRMQSRAYDYLRKVGRWASREEAVGGLRELEGVEGDD